MILQPAILALLLVATVNPAILLAASPLAAQLARRWDLSSGSELQLRLERRTYLLALLVRLVLVSQLLSLFLFVFNADHMAPLFVAAMCAVGSLNAAPYGFAALHGQMAVFFLAAVWLALHHADSLAENYPLTRVKFTLLLALAPVVAATSTLEWLYFTGLRADVVTSCCARLFTPQAEGAAAGLAAWPLERALPAYFAVLALAFLSALWTALRSSGGAALALASLAALFTTLAGVVSFLSLYVYEHPHHHCPFCLLKPEFGHVGYLLYPPLFTATAAGLACGALALLGRRPGLASVTPRLVRRLAALAALGFLWLACLSAFLIWRSNLRLLA